MPLSLPLPLFLSVYNSYEYIFIYFCTWHFSYVRRVLFFAHTMKKRRKAVCSSNAAAVAAAEAKKNVPFSVTLNDFNDAKWHTRHAFLIYTLSLACTCLINLCAVHKISKNKSQLLWREIERKKKWCHLSHVPTVKFESSTFTWSHIETTFRFHAVCLSARSACSRINGFDGWIRRDKIVRTHNLLFRFLLLVDVPVVNDGKQKKEKFEMC